MNLRNKLRGESNDSEKKETLNISISMYDNGDIGCTVDSPESATKQEVTDGFYSFLSKYFIPFGGGLLSDTKAPAEHFKKFLDIRENDIKELRDMIDSGELG